MRSSETNIQDQIETEINKKSVRIIYFNSHYGQFNITTDVNEKAIIEVYDIMGIEVYQSSVNETTNKMNIFNQPKGIYLSRVTVGN